jgi:hypothetical protein
MAEVISIQGYTLAGLNFAVKNVAENKKLFGARLETWLHRIDDAGGDLSDEDKKVFGDQEQAIQFVVFGTISSQEDIEIELKVLCDLVVPLNTLSDWGEHNLTVLEEGEKEADAEDKELYSSVIKAIQGFVKEVNDLSSQVSELTEQLKRSKELMAVV